ncbi:MAG TPA: hypothetical protein VJT32_12425 [bacterium]|nr:hypothetical protein [bacterium]
MVRYPPRWLCAWAGALAVTVALAGEPLAPSLAADEPVYMLYYRLELPLATPTLTLTDNGTKRTFAGTFRGVLGGLPLTSGTYSYGNGASERAGGGTFTLATRAGSVNAGEILMTNDGKQTTLLFFGTYLGARLSFSVVGSGSQIGGTGVVSTGLAETSFQSDEEYLTAVRQAAATLPPDARAEVVGEANQNLRLVREYRLKNPAR